MVTLSLLIGHKAYAKESDFVIEDGVLISYRGTSKKVTIPDSVVVIGSRAFSDSTATEVIIPDTVKKLRDFAFHYSAIEKIVIPKSVEIIEECAFLNCEKLKDITIKNKNIEIGQNAFKNTAWLNNRLKENAFVVINNNLVYYSGNDPIIYIPDGIRVICGGSFSDTNGIEVVYLPNSVEIIGDYAFAQMEDLIKVHMEDSVKIIRNNAFWLCKDLTDIRLSKNLTTIGDYAFYDTIFTIEILPESVKTIGNNVFGTGSFSLYEIVDLITYF